MYNSARWKYWTLVISFAILMGYLLFCAVMCAIAAAHQGGGAYSVMLFSIIATYGGTSAILHFRKYTKASCTVYFFSSVLSFDPWHMFTSFIPYMLLSPTYINVLNVYAFCNLDDVRHLVSCPPCWLLTHSRFPGARNSKQISRRISAPSCRTALLRLTLRCSQTSQTQMRCMKRVWPTSGIVNQFRSPRVLARMQRRGNKLREIIMQVFGRMWVIRLMFIYYSRDINCDVAVGPAMLGAIQCAYFFLFVLYMIPWCSCMQWLGSITSGNSRWRRPNVDI